MKPNIERLRLLYEMLDGIPANRVDCTQNYRPAGLKVELSTRSVLSWASLYPPFVMQGLRATQKGTPHYRGYFDIEAGALFFGLNEEQVITLFLPQGHVAKHRPSTLLKLRKLLLQNRAISEERYFELLMKTTRFPKELP